MILSTCLAVPSNLTGEISSMGIIDRICIKTINISRRFFQIWRETVFFFYQIFLNISSEYILKETFYPFIFSWVTNFY
jgi:hypothetical protein